MSEAHDSPNRKIYGEYERLVPITVAGRVFEVPEGIALIRAFQYIQYEIGGVEWDWGLYCFNDTIGCCTSTFLRPGAKYPVVGRACCERVVEGLEVVVPPDGTRVLEE